MNKIKKLKIFAALLAFILCFPLHFLYDKFPCFITSIIAPVNESIAEHMKLLFGSIIISGIIQKIIVIIKKLDIKNVCISNFTAAVLSIPIFLIMFLPVYSLIGKNLPITIVIMFIAIIISEIISYYIMKRSDLKLENIAIVFVLITYIVFGLFTYFPPHNKLFIDPLDNTYGIKKSLG